MKRVFFWTELALLFVFSTALCFAEEPKKKEPKILDLPGEIRYRISKEYNRFSHKIAEAIFDKIEDFKIMEFSSETRSLQVRLGRSVYDNHDVFNSYTVVDTIQLPFNLYGWSESIGGQYFSLNFGVGGNFLMRNLRQVGRNQISDLEDIELKAQSVANTDWMNSASAASANTPPLDPNNPPYKEINDKGENDPLVWLDSMNSARFRKLWNMVAFPARMPFKVDWLKRLDDGEIVVYGGSGFVELGPSFGYSKTITGFAGEDVDTGTISATWRYFLAGEFTIAVMKESDRKVKLKFRRYLQSGQRASFGGSTSRLEIYDGFAVGSSNVASIGFSLVPFSLSWSDSGGPILEIGYQFDLESPEGQEAFEKAVLGKLAFADQVAENHKGNQDAPVMRLFHKEGKEDVVRNSRDMKIIFYKRSRSAEQRRSDVKLTLKDGEHKLYTAVAENTYSSRVHFGSRERLVTKTTVDHNKGFAGMIFEGWIEDTSTSGMELNEYQDIVEKTLNRGKIFERVPAFAPVDPQEATFTDGNPPGPTERAVETGRSSFYYRMDMDTPMIQTFVNTPETDRWKIMEKIFGIPEGTWSNPAQRFMLKVMQTFGAVVNLALYPFDLRFRSVEALFIADRAVDDWQDVNDSKDTKEFTYNLGHFFSDSVYGPEMMEAFSRAVETHKPPFFLTASNYSFGRIVLQEGTFSGVGKTLEEYRRVSQIDSPQVGYNASLAVKSFTAEVLDENQIKLTLDLPVRPRYLYFRVTNTGFIEKNEKELVVLNYGQADAGQTVLILDKRDASYKGALAKVFTERKYYKVYFGIGLGSRDWSPVVSQSVYYPFGQKDGPEEPQPAPQQ